MEGTVFAIGIKYSSKTRLVRLSLAECRKYLHSFIVMDESRICSDRIMTLARSFEAHQGNTMSNCANTC